MVQIAHYQFKPEDFPVTIIFRRLQSDLIVHEIQIDNPGAFRIPFLGPGHYVQIIKDGKVVQDSRE